MTTEIHYNPVTGEARLQVLGEAPVSLGARVSRSEAVLAACRLDYVVAVGHWDTSGEFHTIPVRHDPQVAYLTIRPLERAVETIFRLGGLDTTPTGEEA